MNQISPTSIRTISGSYFDFLNPREFEFDIRDIAHGLSHLCRYTGHTQTFYSVAQHCVLASQIVQPENAFAALMHDAAEAFMGDVSKPLKNLLPDYQRIERSVEEAIFAYYGLPETPPEEVKIADRICLATEQRDIVGAKDDIWIDSKDTIPRRSVIVAWTSDQAYRAFLDRYCTLVGDPHYATATSLAAIA
jgi:hypothetical protein